MAGSLIAIPANGAAIWSDFTTITTQLIGLGAMSISLSEVGTTAAPSIQLGSAVEVDGSFYRFDSTSAITDTGIANGSDLWVKLSASSTTLTPSFTTSKPSWNAAKQGWYSTGSDRYVAWCRKSTGGAYLYKHILPQDNQDSIEFNNVININTWNMDGTASVSIKHNLGSNFNKIREIDVKINNDAGTSLYDLYADLNFDDTSLGDGIAGWIGVVNSSNIVLVRQQRAGAPLGFDSSDFNSTSVQRGFVSIKYEVSTT
jgi:hypothetical protein